LLRDALTKHHLKIEISLGSRKLKSNKNTISNLL